MVSFNVPLPEQTNSGASALAGIQAGQNMALHDAQMLAYQEQARQRQLENERLQATQSLAKAAIAGDPNSLAQLSAIAPDAAKGIRDYNNYKINRTAQIAQGIVGLPLAAREQATKRGIEFYQKEFGETPPFPGMEHGYSKETDEYLKQLITQSRDVEKVAQDEFQRPLQEQKVISEALGQQKTKADIAKTYQEINASKQEQERIKSSGLSPIAYKKTQEALGEAAANESLNKAGFQPKLSGEGAKTLTIAQDGLNSISSIRNLLFEKTGSLKNTSGKTIGGASFLPNILQSEDQQAFEVSRSNLTDLIGRLRSGGAISKDEEARYTRLVPKFGDKPDTIKKKLSQLENNFSTLEKGVLGTSKSSAQPARQPLEDIFK